VCDTLFVRAGSGALFAKNSDRPVSEAQVVEALPPRTARAGGKLRTQYLEIGDCAGAAILIARPVWLWGAEHGVNEHGVAVGNEKVHTARRPATEPAALLGMDLVRLALERARSAEQAVDVITSLIEAHGQGGVADETTGEAYFSSYLAADAAGSYIVETSDRTWVVGRRGEQAAISNRLSVGSDWVSASADVGAGADFDEWRDRGVPTSAADRRLAASRAFLAGAAGLRRACASDVVAHLRDHGTGPWGAPAGGADGASSGSAPPQPPPAPPADDPTSGGTSVCMHVRGRLATTSSMVVDLLPLGEGVVRAYVATGSPCCSPYIPVFFPGGVAPELGEENVWRRLAAVRARVERDPAALAAVRGVFAPLESELWAEADEMAAGGRTGRAARDNYAAAAGRRLIEALAAAEALS
jgi:secernin